LRIVSKGYAVKSKARMLLGAAAIPPGVGVFLPRNSPWVPVMMGLGIGLFLLSLFLLRREIAVIRARQAGDQSQPQSPPAQPRRRRRR
jgi:hypothetical protein